MTALDYLISHHKQNSDVRPETLLDRTVKITLEYATIVGRVFYDGQYYRLADAYWRPCEGGNPPAQDFTYLFMHYFNNKDLTIL